MLMPQWCCDAFSYFIVSASDLLSVVQDMLVSIECSAGSRLSEHAFTDNLGCSAAGLQSLA